jgi:alpha-L-arabinofuranosidase
MKSFSVLLLTTLLGTLHLSAVEHHVSPEGDDANTGARESPFKTISTAALKAMPGDTVTVHEGTYRERINPPRGGTSNEKRITYQAARGEKVVITGSDVFKTWEKVSGDTWKLVIPNSYFGSFNPYAEKVHGDWFDGQGRSHRRGNVYRDGVWLAEAPSLDAVMQPAGAKRMWFSTVDGVVDDGPQYLMNIVSLKPGKGAPVVAGKPAQRSGTQNAPCSEGGECVGFISQGNWLRYDGVDFGTNAESVVIRAATHPGTGGVIELRDGHFDGPLLGTCEVGVTGDWQKWQDFTATIKPTSGVKNLYLVFKSMAAAKAETAATGKDKTTTIFAQFPGINPNEGTAEICVRPTVFTPEKTNIDYITVRGFELRNAATNWAAPTAGQVGLVTAYWSKGWIIENNEICYSRCGGVALGKYSDEWDGKRGTTEGYYFTIEDAQKKDGWTKEKIGSHTVRNNHIHHCGQVGIVGSLGCAFSRIEGNDIHECNMQGIWAGAEMAGIKFHGAIDTVISGNHIHHNGNPGGLWLDWMAQGTQITNNLFHDNTGHDLFTEVDHGPFLVANNLFLSRGAYQANAEGGAFAHNLVAGSFNILPDGRRTPFMKPHSTETAGLHDCPVGDVQWHNNLLASGANLAAYNQAGPTWPCEMSGNVFTKGSQASRFEKEALLKPEFDPAIKLTQKTDGWYLTLATERSWRDAAKRSLVTTNLLGKAKIPDQSFENPDGSPLKVDTDYFGEKRVSNKPFPGPIESPADGTREIKVWPKPRAESK